VEEFKGKLVPEVVSVCINYLNMLSCVRVALCLTMELAYAVFKICWHSWLINDAFN
jgi:hypothetical protein